MSLGKRLFIGEAAAAACYTDDVNPFTGTSADGGVALYSLDYDASDAGGNYDGTPTDVTFGVDGEINWGASFNGSSSEIDTGFAQNTSNAFSWSCWVKPEGTQPTYATIMDSMTATATYQGVTLMIISGEYILALSGSTSNLAYTAAAATDGAWAHLVCTHDGSGNWNFYVNNTQILTTDKYHNTDINSGLSIKLGNARYSGWTSFIGSIDQVRIFNKELSSDEVSTLYGETACVYTSTTDTVNYQATNVAYYKLDNNALDETSNNYDGAESNITYEFGRYGQAAVFNGSSSKIVLPNSSLGITDAANFTISCWFNTNSSTQDNQSIIWTNGSNAGARFGVGINSTSQGEDTSVFFGVGTSSFTYINSGTSAFTANTWVHVVCVKSSTTGMSLYVDNVLKATNTNATGAASYNASSGENRIGGYKTTAESSWFNGKIDQVRIYNSALDATAVENLYNEKQAYITKNASDPFGDGDEEAFYKFDNNTNDSTGSYNMTNRNITFSTDSAIGTYSGEFNGTSSEGIISSTTTTPVDFSAEDFTISFWAKVDNFTNTVYPLAKWGASNSVRTLLTSIRPTGYEDFAVYENDGSGQYQMIHSQTLEADRWYHFAYTRNGSTGTIYVDGVGESFARNNTINNPNNDMFIGNVSETAALWFDGHIDSMRFFSRCLDGDEVFKLYAEVIN